MLVKKLRKMQMKCQSFVSVIKMIWRIQNDAQ